MDELIKELETLENKEYMIEFLVRMIQRYKEKTGYLDQTE